MMRFRNVVGACLPALGLLVLLNSTARAQGSFPFELRIQQGNNVFIVPNDATLVMPANAVGNRAADELTDGQAPRGLAIGALFFEQVSDAKVNL